MSMYRITADQRSFYNQYYGSLVGATIKACFVKEEDEEGESWPYIKAEMPNGDVVEIEVSRDEEGNGPGFLFGLFAPEKKVVDGPVDTIKNREN